MSAALERVIAEQQAEIDRLKSRLESALKTGQASFKGVETICERAATVADWHHLRSCWKDDKGDQWKEYSARRHALQDALRAYGFCLNCHTLGCDGECYET